MLSIVIPTYCRPDLLRLCLESVTRYAPSQTQIIVVDDASRDARIRETVDQFANIQLIRLNKRSGFCKTVNVGIHAARHEIVELLNDDTEVTKNWVPAADRWFRDPRVAAVAPLVTTGDRIDSAGDSYYIGGVARKRGHLSSPIDRFAKPCDVFGASASSAFYRRSALLKVGGFPESFGAYFDDIDVAFRLQRAGYRTVFDPASRVRHAVSASHGTADRRLLEQQSHNEERVFWRNIPWSALSVAFWQHLGVLAGKARRRWQDGTLTPFVLGRLRVLTEFAAICRHRRNLKMLGPDAPPARWQIENYTDYRRSTAEVG